MTGLFVSEIVGANVRYGRKHLIVIFIKKVANSITVVDYYNISFAPDRITRGDFPKLVRQK